MEFDKNENFVMIGIKPFMNYATALKMQFDNNDEVFVCARGKFISKAFDVIEVCKKAFLSDWDIVYREMIVDSKSFISDSGKEFYVSCIEIKLSKEFKKDD